jgi:hypothetical protein
MLSTIGKISNTLYHAVAAVFKGHKDHMGENEDVTTALRGISTFFAKNNGIHFEAEQVHAILEKLTPVVIHVIQLAHPTIDRIEEDLKVHFVDDSKTPIPAHELVAGALQSLQALFPIISFHFMTTLAMKDVKFTEAQLHPEFAAVQSVVQSTLEQYIKHTLNKPENQEALAAINAKAKAAQYTPADAPSSNKENEAPLSTPSEGVKMDTPEEVKMVTPEEVKMDTPEEEEKTDVESTVE